MIELFQYLFFRNAVLSCVFAGISCGLIGAYIVNRRMVFISGGISHASFGGLGIGYFLGMNPIIGAAIFSAISAIGIEYVSNNSRIKHDSTIGIFWSFGMAVGLIFIYFTPGYAPDLMGYLFGNILTVTIPELFIMASLTIILIIIFRIFYRKILYLSFDSEFLKTQKERVTFYNYFLIVMTALTIVIYIRVVGIILVISLLTIPQAIASLFTSHYKNLLIFSSLWAVLISFSGLFFSYYFNIPSGAAIVFLGSVLYFFLRFIFYCWKRIKK